ncbi:MAG: pentapeptide repeat-containing protein [Myxococcota bacterium]|nr:pentapeptide repeat-containing protein [Myxococcota bacterium]
MAKSKTDKSTHRRFREPKDKEAFHLLHNHEIDRFHQKIEGMKEVDFSGCSLRGVDFRRVDMRRINIQGSYLRGADLRGVDLRAHDLEGCSFHDSIISGSYLPPNVTPDEVIMSIRHGTRIRTTGPLPAPVEDDENGDD